MVTDIGRAEMLALVKDGGQIVDVLPETEYAAQHIPGAVSIPLRQLTSDTTAALRRDKPVVVY